MSISVGDRLPDVTLKTQTADGIQEIRTGELAAGKKLVIFAVPGAFTPTCSDEHLPGFQVATDQLKGKGADTIACVASNDPFVVGAWEKARNVGDDILMLADGNGDLAQALGLVLDLSHIGFGKRSKRYALVVDDGTVAYVGVEDGPGVGPSGAQAVLAAL